MIGQREPELGRLPLGKGAFEIAGRRFDFRRCPGAFHIERFGGFQGTLEALARARTGRRRSLEERVQPRLLLLQGTQVGSIALGTAAGADQRGCQLRPLGPSPVDVKARFGSKADSLGVPRTTGNLAAAELIEPTRQLAEARLCGVELGLQGKRGLLAAPSPVRPGSDHFAGRSHEAKVWVGAGHAESMLTVYAKNGVADQSPEQVAVLVRGANQREDAG